MTTTTPADLAAFAEAIGETPTNEGHGFLALHVGGAHVYAPVKVGAL